MVFSYHDAEITVTDYTVDEAGQYCFELTEINPQCMGDNITATLHATKDGAEVTDSVANYSVRQYCINQLAKTEDAKLITRLSDLLAYGAAAQRYTDYKTEELVTDGLSLTPSSFAALEGKQISFTGEKSNEADWTSAALILSNNLAMKFTFRAQNTEGLTVNVSINGRTESFTAKDFVSEGNGKYSITFRGILATELDDAVTASFVRNGENIGRAVSYSVNTYICGTQNSTNETLAQLVQALCNYGKAAQSYAK